MPGNNRDGYFLLTEAVAKNALLNILSEADILFTEVVKIPVSVNHLWRRTSIRHSAKGLTVQWQRPLAGVLPPRVQTLGAAPN